MKNYYIPALVITLFITTSLQGCRTTISPNGKVTIDTPARGQSKGHNHGGNAHGNCHRHNRLGQHCQR